MAKSSDIIKIGFDYRASLEQFEKETNGVFDGISEKAGKQRISIQLDAKNDKVIEKIKELQKLKLDSFTFEFGESGLAEQLKTFDQLEKKITEIINLSNGINNIGSGNGIGNSIVDEKSLNSIIDLFGKMESHLGEMKKVFADVGDGEEFSPLLKMINDVQASIKELSTSVSKIKLDVNMDLGSGVNEERLNQKVSQSMNRQLEAYRNLFTAMKSTGKTNKEMLRFFEPDDVSISEIIGAYKGMIKRAEEQFGKDIYKNKIGKDAYSAYIKEIKNATDQFNRATNKKNTENPLGDLFGKNELIEVVSQLGLIADRLSEISSTVSGLGDTFKNVFKEGFNVSASVEEIDKLTGRVKELEDELSKVKVSSTPPIKDTFQGDKIQETVNSARELDRTLEGVEIPKENFDEVIVKFNIIEEKAKNIAKITQSSVWNQAKNNYDTSYTVKYKDGSSEILGENSNPQKLRSQNVLYDTKQIEKEAKALERAAKQAQKLAEEKRKARQADKQATQSSVDKALKDQLDAWEAIQKIRLQIAQTDSKDTEKLHNLNEQKKALQKQYNEAGKVLKANKDLYNQTEQQVKLDHERLETNEKINKLKLNNVDVGSVLSKGDSDLKKFEARKNQSEEYRGTVEKLKQSIEELRVLENSRVSSKLLSEEEVQNINKAVASIEEYTNAIKNMPAVEKGSDEGSRTKLANRIHEYMDKNTRMTREFREEFENLIRVLRSGDDSVNIKDIARQFEDVKFRVKEAKLEGKSFFDIFKDKAIYGFAARLAQYYLSFYDFIRYARYAINALIELDSALLDLKKTTAMTENQLEDFYYASNDIAKQMGVTTAEIIEQASAWSRLGYSSQEAATKMAQLSSQFASISPGMETDQAQEGLVSIMKAWDIDPDEVESEIMDNINILGNSFAESNADIVEGMKRSAAALSAVGTEYKDAFALFTGAQEILQNAEVTGRALRSISMRVRGYSESSEDGFEELDDELKNITGDLIDLTKTAEHSQGVSIFKDGSTTEFKSLVEYFGEISEIWDEMTQKQQNDFLQKAFGKTQAQAGAALIQNFEAVRDSLEVMENSAGSADREMSIVQETLEYKINALKQTWVGTVQEMIERGDLGAIIDGLTKFSEAIGKVTGTVGLGGTLGLGLGAFLGVKNIGREKCYPSSNMPIVI